MSPRIDVSIIVVNWNALALTTAAVTSILDKVSGVTYEIFVVDNNSTLDDSSSELPRRLPSVVFIANEDNRGFSSANNQAMGRARGRYILLLNNDTEQTEDSISKSVEYMDERLDVGAVGVRHFNADAARSKQESSFRFPSPWRDIAGLLGLAWFIQREESLCSSNGGDVDWVVGSYLFIRRACLDAVGLLDERFFLYDEDIDWCKRANDAGWKVHFWPGTSLIHIGSAVSPYMSDKTFLHFRSRLSYYRKHYTIFTAVAYYAAMCTRLVLATCKCTVLAGLGRAGRQDIVVKITRLWMFASLAHGRGGVTRPV